MLIYRGRAFIRKFSPELFYKEVGLFRSAFAAAARKDLCVKIIIIPPF